MENENVLVEKNIEEDEQNNENNEEQEENLEINKVENDENDDIKEEKAFEPVLVQKVEEQRVEKEEEEEEKNKEEEEGELNLNEKNENENEEIVLNQEEEKNEDENENAEAEKIEKIEVSENKENVDEENENEGENKSEEVLEKEEIVEKKDNEQLEKEKEEEEEEVEVEVEEEQEEEKDENEKEKENEKIELANEDDQNENVNENQNENNEEVQEVQLENKLIEKKERNDIINKLNLGSNQVDILYSKDEDDYNITFKQKSPSKKLILHWGIYKNSPITEWHHPNKENYPLKTKEFDSFALETEFIDEGEESKIEFKLPKNEAQGMGISFVFYDPINNIWYNNDYKDYQVEYF